MSSSIVRATLNEMMDELNLYTNEVMDELNLYHGTNADFDNFDVAYMSTGAGQQAHGYGFYLTTSYDVAKSYSNEVKGGQVMEVEVPDGKYLDDRSISSREADRIARIFFKYMTEENEDTRDSYPDADTRQAFWDYEVDYVRRCSTGSYVYGTIASLMGSDQDTSKFLHDKCGYVGLKIRDIYSNEKKSPITYVIFDQNDIKILKKNVLNEKVSKEDLNKFKTTFTFGKYNGQDKVKVILEDPEYCVWLYNKMRYSPFTDNQLGLLDVSYYKKYRVFPIKSCKTPNYAQIKGVLVKNMTAEQLSYVYENGTDEFKWLVKQEHTNRGWHYHPYKRYPVFQTDDLYENIVKRQDVGDIEKSVHDKAVDRFGMFRLGGPILSCIYEAAFQLLGFERFGINGEIIYDNKVMDNPWDDAYAILDWAVKNKGLDKKYLGKVSSLYSGMSDDEFKTYCEQVQNGQRFLFSREELAEIIKYLPDKLRGELVKDMVNVGRIGKVQEMVEYLKNYNDGQNLEEFIQIMKQKYRNGEIQKGGIGNLSEPVRQAMVSSRMIGSGK